MPKATPSSGNSKPVSPKSTPTKPAAPGMGTGGPRTVKGPKVDPRSKPSLSKGMGTASPVQNNPSGMGKAKVP